MIDGFQSILIFEFQIIQSRRTSLFHWVEIDSFSIHSFTVYFHTRFKPLSFRIFGLQMSLWKWSKNHYMHLRQTSTKRLWWIRVFYIFWDVISFVSWRIVRIDDLFRFDPKKYFQSSGSELWNYYPRLIDLLLGQLYTVYYIKITDSVLFFKWPDSGFQITLGDLTLTQKWTFKVFDTVRSHS